MPVITGMVTLSGLSDEDMIKVFRYKAKRGSFFDINLQSIERTRKDLIENDINQSNGHVAVYHKLIITWECSQGFKVVSKLLDELAETPPYSIELASWRSISAE